MQVLWVPRALRELDSAYSYVARDSVAAAERLVETLLRAGDGLEAFPHMGREGRVSGTRELVVSGTDHILPYRTKAGKVRILAVLHGARRWPKRL